MPPVPPARSAAVLADADRDDRVPNEYSLTGDIRQTIAKKVQHDRASVSAAAAERAGGGIYATPPPKTTHQKPPLHHHSPQVARVLPPAVPPRSPKSLRRGIPQAVTARGVDSPLRSSGVNVAAAAAAGVVAAASSGAAPTLPLPRTLSPGGGAARIEISQHNTTTDGVTDWKSTAAQRGSRIVSHSNWLEVCTLMHIAQEKGRTKVKMVKAKKPKKYFAVLKGAQLMLFKSKSDNFEKMKAQYADLTGSVEGCVAHQMAKNADGSLPAKGGMSFALAFRTGGVKEPNIVFQCHTKNVMERDVWIKYLLLAAAMHETLTTEPHKCVAKLKANVRKLGDTLNQAQSQPGRGAGIAGINDALLKQYRWQCYLQAALSSAPPAARAPSSTQRWFDQPDHRELLASISDEIRQTLAKLGPAGPQPVGLCLLLHADKRSRQHNAPRQTNLLPISVQQQPQQQRHHHHHQQEALPPQQQHSPPRKTSWFSGRKGSSDTGASKSSNSHTTDGPVGGGTSNERNSASPDGARGRIGSMSKAGASRTSSTRPLPNPFAPASHSGGNSDAGAGAGAGAGGMRPRALTKPSAALKAEQTKKKISKYVQVMDPLPLGKSGLRVSLTGPYKKQYKLAPGETVGELIARVAKKLSSKRSVLDPKHYYMQYTGGPLGAGPPPARRPSGSAAPLSDAVLVENSAVVSTIGVKFSMHCKPEPEVTMVCPSGASFGLELQLQDGGVVCVQDVTVGGIAQVHGIQKDDEVLAINATKVEGSLAAAVRLLEESTTAIVKVRRHRNFDEVFTSTESKALEKLLLDEMHVPQVSSAADNDLKMFALGVEKPSDLGLEFEGAAMPPPPAAFASASAASATTAANGGLGLTAADVSDLELEAIEQRLAKGRGEIQEIGVPENVDGSNGGPPHKKQSQLQHLLDELLTTEKSYFRDLMMMTNKFLEPLQNQDFLSRREKKLCAETPPRLLSFQRTFTERMVAAAENPPAEYIAEAMHAFQSQDDGDGDDDGNDEEDNYVDIADVDGGQSTSGVLGGRAGGGGAGGGAGGAAAARQNGRSTKSKTKAKRHHSTVSVDLENSMIEESMYDTLEIIKSWDRPEVQTDSSLYPGPDQQHGVHQDAGISGGGGMLRRPTADRADRVQSLYMELDMVQGDPFPPSSPPGQGSSMSAAAAMAVRGFAAGVGARPPSIVAEASVSKAAGKWVKGALGRRLAPEVHAPETRLAASLQLIGELFKELAAGFRVYADYVAWHMAGSKLLVQTENQELVAFLSKQNTANSVVTNLSSYLLKPIQRVLKYPLLLKKMCEECTKDRDSTGNTVVIFENANHALLGAFKVMSELAGTINEVTRRTERFGPLLQRAIPGFEIGRAMGGLMVHAKDMTWLNPSDSKKSEAVELLIFPAMVVMFGVLSSKQSKKSGGRLHILHRIIPSTTMEMPPAGATMAQAPGHLQKLPVQDLEKTWVLVRRKHQLLKEEKYFLVSDSAEDKQAAADAVRTVIKHKLTPPAVYEDASASSATAVL